MKFPEKYPEGQNFNAGSSQHKAIQEQGLLGWTGGSEPRTSTGEN